MSATATPAPAPADILAASIEAARSLAVAAARPRTRRIDQGKGRYPVTVGGYVVGEVRRITVWQARGHYIEWGAVNSYDAEVLNPHGFHFNTRAEAVAALGATDFAVEAYRAAAREGAFGTAETDRIAAEDAALQDAIDAEAKAERQAAEAKAERQAAEAKAERAAEAAIAVIRFAVGDKITNPEFGEATVFAVRPQIVHGVPSVRYGVEFANGGAWSVTDRGWTRVTA